MIKTLDENRVAKLQQRRFNYIRGFDTHISYDALGNEQETVIFDTKEGVGGRGLPAFYTFSGLKQMVRLALDSIEKGFGFMVLASDNPLLGLMNMVIYYNTEIVGVINGPQGEQIVKEKAEHLVGEWAIPIENFKNDEEMEEFQKWRNSF